MRNAGRSGQIDIAWSKGGHVICRHTSAICKGEDIMLTGGENAIRNEDCAGNVMHEYTCGVDYW